MNEKVNTLKEILGRTDMYLIDLVQKGYFDHSLQILDVGCGRGRNMWMLSHLGHHVQGIDADANVIAEVNQEISENPDKANVEVRVGQVESIPFPNQNFDFVICIAVLHFAKDRNHFEQQFSELVRVTKPGGVVFLRLVSSHTFSALSNSNQRALLPDGTERFVVDHHWLLNSLIPAHGLTLSEEFKTVNVEEKRAMTTLVLRAK